MALLFMEVWGEYGRDVRGLRGVLGTPAMNTYQEKYMCPLSLVGGKGVRGLGEFGEGWS